MQTQLQQFFFPSPTFAWARRQAVEIDAPLLKSDWPITPEFASPARCPQNSQPIFINVRQYRHNKIPYNHSINAVAVCKNPPARCLWRATGAANQRFVSVTLHGLQTFSKRTKHCDKWLYSLALITTQKMRGKRTALTTLHGNLATIN